MKHKNKSALSIKINDSQKTVELSSPVSFVCNFFTLFSASTGFLLSLAIALSIPWNFKTYAFWIIALSLFYSLFYIQKNNLIYRRILFLIFFSGFCFAFLRFYKTFFLEAKMFLSSFSHSFEQCYQITLYQGFPFRNSDFQLFFPFLLSMFLLLFYLTTLSKKKRYILFLLMIPVFLIFLLDKVPSYASLGLLLFSFLLSDTQKEMLQEKKGLFLLPVFIMIFYLFCAYVLVPKLSPVLFQWTDSLYQAVNRISIHLPAQNSDSPTDNSSQTQTLTNKAPVHSNKKMFRFTADFKPTEPIYLRGFIGSSYSETKWISPGKEDWKLFLRYNKRNADDADIIYNLPYQVLSASDKTNIRNMSLEPYFPTSYTYLPMGVEIPSNLKADETNRIKIRSSKRLSFEGLPLSPSNAHFLEKTKLSSKDKIIEQLYRRYIETSCLDYNLEEISLIWNEIQQLPVYQSLNSSPAREQLPQIIQEIQQFLWGHASYSLSLNPISSKKAFIENFLYQDQKGFCIHFATAGTLLFRMYGIPARYVSGYTAYPEDFSSSFGQTYSCDILDSDAHAWTEIYVGAGGWIPVEMTPTSADYPSESSSIPPVTPPVTEPVEDITKEENLNNLKKENPEKLPEFNTSASSQKASASFLSVLRIAVLFLFGMLLLFTFLMLYQVLCFRKHLGYFVSSSHECYRQVFKNLIHIWEKLYDLSCTNPSDSVFFHYFEGHLPSKERLLFLSLYQQAEAFTFGKNKPSKKQIRELRYLYQKYRKKLLKNSSFLKKFLYSFMY